MSVHNSPRDGETFALILLYQRYVGEYVSSEVDGWYKSYEKAYGYAKARVEKDGGQAVIMAVVGRVGRDL